MTKEDLKRLANGAKYTRAELTKWIDSLPNTPTNNRTVEKVNRGDVLYHPIFQHPIVVLKKKEDYLIVASLTSDSKCSEILEPCRSRMFSNSYITTTLIMIRNYKDLKLRGLYDNNRHLDKVYKKLKELI